MQVLIEIDEDTYKDIKKGKIYTSVRDVPQESVLAIANGTPLPKNHGDLIDVNRKITVSTYDEQYEEWGEKSMTVLDALNKWSDEGVKVEDVIIPADKEKERSKICR